jgi:hypothetical protein
MHRLVQVVAKLVGEGELPWEAEGRAKAVLRRAGRFKDAVLGLQHRDPSQRARVQTFVQQYAAIMSTTTQQQLQAIDDADAAAEVAE